MCEGGEVSVGERAFLLPERGGLPRRALADELREAPERGQVIRVFAAYLSKDPRGIADVAMRINEVGDGEEPVRWVAVEPFGLPARGGLELLPVP